MPNSVHPDDSVQYCHPSALLPCDDPSKLTNICEPMWHITEKLQVGQFGGGEMPTACSPTALTAGNFVDIAFTFDIFIMKTRRGRQVVRAHLNLEHVLQLMPLRHADAVSGLCAPHSATKVIHSLLLPPRLPNRLSYL
jgi:hypothetical protein